MIDKQIEKIFMMMLSQILIQYKKPPAFVYELRVVFGCSFMAGLYIPFADLKVRDEWT